MTNYLPKKMRKRKKTAALSIKKDQPTGFPARKGRLRLKSGSFDEPVKSRKYPERVLPANEPVSQ
jgi:hypothetical protein